MTGVPAAGSALGFKRNTPCSCKMRSFVRVAAGSCSKSLSGTSFAPR